jgi:hypothetical protein
MYKHDLRGNCSFDCTWIEGSFTSRQLICSYWLSAVWQNWTFCVLRHVKIGCGAHPTSYTISAVAGSNLRAISVARDTTLTWKNRTRCTIVYNPDQSRCFNWLAGVPVTARFSFRTLTRQVPRFRNRTGWWSGGWLCGIKGVRVWSWSCLSSVASWERMGLVMRRHV